MKKGIDRPPLRLKMNMKKSHTKLRETILKADSPKQAFYRLRMEALAHGQGFIVTKESGTGDKVLNSESWHRETPLWSWPLQNLRAPSSKKPTRIKKGRVYRIEHDWKARARSAVSIKIPEKAPQMSLFPEL